MENFTADELSETLEELVEKFGDRRIVTQDGKEVSFVDFDRHSDYLSKGNVFIIQTEER